MKAIILAAGQGSRMRPLTNDKHKCMLEIAGNPIIRNQINKLNNCNINEIAIVTGYREDDIKNYLLNEVQYYFNPFYETTNSIVSLWFAKEFLNEDIIIINSDVIFEETLIKSIMEDKSDICIAVSQEWSPDRGYKVQIENNHVVNMGMNIPPDKTGGEYAGIIKVSNNKLTTLKNKLDLLMKQKQFNIWFEDMIVELIKEGAAAKYVYVDTDLWYEIDTVEELELARKKFMKMGKDVIK